LQPTKCPLQCRIDYVDIAGRSSARGQQSLAAVARLPLHRLGFLVVLIC